ncbi:acyltransferase [uncultured Desulfobulbus sp.]|uniref:acyltransferase n=1 Tax=uncultured Desulfobulbus sp. TaxID=239745 RepID=UPI0029C8A587|nr:acyltransferase [uncultured Desulfobulbus sp.]
MNSYIANIFNSIIEFVIKCKRKFVVYDKYKEDYLSNVQTLIKRGLVVGKNVTIETGVLIDGSYPYLISIGDNSSIAMNVRIFAHDDAPVKFGGNFVRLGKVDIKENCFIGDSCIILPGVTIGPNVIVAAGSVVNKSIPPDTCVAGVPARFYANFHDVIENVQEKAKVNPVFFSEDLRHENLTEELKSEVRKAVFNDTCFVQRKSVRPDLYILWNRTE